MPDCGNEHPKTWFDVPFIVAFRSRFSQLFDAAVTPDLGPQDVEDGVLSASLSPALTALACSLASLCMNRSRPIVPGSHGRALYDCIKTHAAEWDPEWRGEHPFASSEVSMDDLPWEQRLRVLRFLVHLCLQHSDAVRRCVDEAYLARDRRHGDRQNPLALYPIGHDELSSAYWLVEGRDTRFRLYRQARRPPSLRHAWEPVASSIAELTAFAEGLSELEHATRMMAAKIRQYILPRLQEAQVRRERKVAAEERKAAMRESFQNVERTLRPTRSTRVRYVYSSSSESDDAGPRRKRARLESGEYDPGLEEQATDHGARAAGAGGSDAEWDNMSDAARESLVVVLSIPRGSRTHDTRDTAGLDAASGQELTEALTDPEPDVLANGGDRRAASPAPFADGEGAREFARLHAIMA